MRTQLISFQQHKNGEKILYYNDDVIDVINSSTADLLIFGGGVLKDSSSILDMTGRITNHHTISLLDSKQDYANNSGVYIIKDGIIEHIDTNRFSFGTQETLNNVDLASSCLDEFESDRIMNVYGKRILVLQGSEINLFKKATGEQRVSLCLDSLPSSYEEKWNQIYQNTDILIQICYKPGKAQYKKVTKNLMANHGKVFLGISNIYTSVSKQGNYVAKDGEELDPIFYMDEVRSKFYKSWIYDI